MRQANSRKIRVALPTATGNHRRERLLNRGTVAQPRGTSAIKRAKTFAYLRGQYAAQECETGRSAPCLLPRLCPVSHPGHEGICGTASRASPSVPQGTLVAQKACTRSPAWPRLPLKAAIPLPRALPAPDPVLKPFVAALRRQLVSSSAARVLVVRDGHLCSEARGPGPFQSGHRGALTPLDARTSRSP